MLDSTPVEWDEDKFPDRNWEDFYPDAKEELPPNMPEARGKAVQVNYFVDADHAGDVVSRRSHTGILLSVEADHANDMVSGRYHVGMLIYIYCVSVI